MLKKKRKPKSYKGLQKEGRNKDITSLVNKLDREGLSRVIQWCVELKSNGWICDNIQEIYRVETNRMGVWRLRNSTKYRPIIAKLRKQFEANILKIPCANKVNRLQTLQKVIDEGLKWTLKNVTKDGEEIYELKLGNVTQAIKEARAEVEETDKKEGNGNTTIIANIIRIFNGNGKKEPTELEQGRISESMDELEKNMCGSRSVSAN